MHATSKNITFAIAGLQVIFSVWAIYEVLALHLAGELSITPLHLWTVLSFLALAIAGGVLLWFKTRIGIGMSIAVQGAQMYYFTAWRISWRVLLGPYLLIQVWPPFSFSYGYTNVIFRPVLSPESYPFTLALNFLPASFIVFLLAFAKNEPLRPFDREAV